MTIQNAAIATLVYHDIFDYPLTLDQIRKYLVGEKADLKKIEVAISVLIKNKKISQKKGLYFLYGRGAAVKNRLSRKRYSAGKLRRAQLFAKILTLVPTIKLVAISGALSMENAAKNDDIDLVIVTAKNTLWTTRLVANLILHTFRRRAGQPHTKDKACMNLFLEETSLKIGTQNLYTAHEIAQMRPLWQRRNAYQCFLSANTWVKNYLPNWKGEIADSVFIFPQTNIMQYLEPVAKFVQLSYMKKKITTEKIGKYQLFFHPRNTEELVLREYIKRLKKLR